MDRSLFYIHKIMQGFLSSYLQTYHNAVSEGLYLTRVTTQKKLKPNPATTKEFENSLFSFCINPF